MLSHLRAIIACLLLSLTVQGEVDMDSLLVKGRDLIRQNPDSATIYYTNLEYSTSDTVNLHHKWSYIGLSEFSSGKFQNSAIAFLEALKYAYNDSLKAKSYNSLGAVYTRLDQFDESLQNYFASLELLLRKSTDSIGIAKVYNNITVLYRKASEFEKSIQFGQKALRIYQEISDSVYLAGTLNNLGTSYLAVENIDSAKYYFERALEVRFQIDDQPGLAQTLNNLGLLFERINEYDKALEYYQKAYDLRRRDVRPYDMLSTRVNIGIVYEKLGNYKRSIDTLMNVLPECSEYGYLEYQSRALYSISESFLKLGQSDSALVYFKKYHVINDSLQKQQSSESFKLLELTYAQEKLEAQNEYLKTQNALQNAREQEEERVLWTTIGIIVLLSVILASIIYQFYRQREMTKYLVESEDKFKKLANAPFTGILIHKNGRIIEVNKELLRMTGYEEREFIGVQIGMLMFDKVRQISDNEKNLPERFELECKDGGVIRVESYGRDIELNGEPVRIVALRDVTEQEKAREAMIRAKEEAEASTRAKSEFLANMSHEIRTPMNGIIGAIDLLKSRELDAEDMELVDVIDVSAHDLLQTINDILDLSKIEANKVKLERETFSITEVLQLIYKLFSYRAVEKNLDFVLNTQEVQCDIVEGDQLRVKQIISNLVNNAIKFTHEGKVEISAITHDLRDGRVLTSISVSDTGIGIPEDQQEQIFQKFTQVDSSAKRSFGGSGLGLAIVKSLSELLGGGVRLKSVEGRGSVFTVEFELKKAETPGVEGVKEFSGSSKEIHVLLVEDNLLNQKVGSMVLTRLGHKFDLAEDGVEAVRKYRSGKYDMIFMDIQMPAMNGIEATQAIRKIEREEGLEPTIIVALTASIMKNEKAEYIRSGMNDAMGKPFRIDEMNAMIRRFFD